MQTKNGHHGVGVIVADENRNVFYIQQKDDNYPIPQFRRCHSVWGGEIEKNEEEQSALERELREELQPEVAETIIRASNRLWETEVVSGGQTYKFTLYEAVLPYAQLREIAGKPVNEGKGVLALKKEIGKLPFIHGLETVLARYFAEKEPGILSRIASAARCFLGLGDAQSTEEEELRPGMVVEQKKDPRPGHRLIYYEDAQVIETLERYKGKCVNELAYWDTSEDFGLSIEKLAIELYDIAITHGDKKINREELAQLVMKGLRFTGVKYEQEYCIELSDGSENISIKAEAIIYAEAR